MRLLKGSTRNLVQPNINGIIDVPVPRKESRNSLANIAQPPQHSRTGSVKGGNYRGRADRTTRMLLTIVCVFLITEVICLYINLIYFFLVATRNNGCFDWDSFV
jgi:hypothetical protein